eukprot:jgi/Bigna1/146292/aug1.112_g21000
MFFSNSDASSIPYTRVGRRSSIPFPFLVAICIALILLLSPFATAPGFLRSGTRYPSSISKTSWKSLDIEEKRASDSRLLLQVTVPKEEVTKIIKKCIKGLEKNSDIPGFRPGKPIPRQVLNQWINPKDLKKQFVNDILNATMPAALRSVKDMALDGSEAIESDFDELVRIFDEKSELKYDIGVDTMPPIKWKTPYQGMEVEVKVFNKPELNNKVVAKAVLSTRKRLAELDNASDREVREGDLIMMSYMGVDKATGEPLIELGGQRPKQFDTDDDSIVPGFMENIIGSKCEEIREFDVEFPDNFSPARYRGTTATFKAMVHQIFEPKMPPEDDNLAKEILESAATLEEAKAFLLEAVEKEAQVKDDELIEEAIIQRIDESFQKAEDIYFLVRFEELNPVSFLGCAGQIAPSVLNSMMTPQMVSKFIRDNGPEIEERVRTVLAFDKIREENALDITAEKVEEQLKEMIENFKTMGMDYDVDAVRGQAEEFVTSKCILDFLKQKIVIKKV